MKYQAYPEYKDSGVILLGEMPTSWEIKRYKNALTLFQGAAFKSSEYVTESDVINIRMGNIKKGGFIDLCHNTKYLPTEYKSNYSQYELRENDLIIAMTDMSPTLDFLAVPAYMIGLDSDKTYLLNQRVGKLIVDSLFSVDYIKYLLLSSELRNQLKAQGLGTVQSNMSSDNLYNSFFVAPDLMSQTQISDFLDHETAKIDTLIEKQQQLIKLLKEKRQAVISHAVTKGLNPKAHMRDSGVEWLGEVPGHWELPKLIHRTTKVGDGLHSTPQYQDGTGYHFVNGNNLVDGKIVIGSTAKEVPEEEYKKHYIHLDNSSLLLSINGTIGNVARYNGEQVILGKSAAYMNCANDLLPEYLMFYLQSSQLQRYYGLEVTGTTIFNLSLNSIRQMKVCVPPAHEQIEIEKYCVNQKKKYRVLIDKVSSGIELMQERRTALISAAVTGKIDVRNWQAPEPLYSNKETHKEEAA
jgi:type I restriction enzyme, S subunit